MRLIKRLAAIVLLLLVFAFGILFSVNNSDRVMLDLLFVQLPEQRISIWILLAFVCGGISGFVASMFALLKMRTENMLLQRQLEKNRQQLTSVERREGQG